jgi:hypothetical protein
MKILALLALALILTGCASTKSFVDPSFPKVSYEELQKQPSPLKLSLTTQFQRNGVPFPEVDPALKENIERVLRVSGLVSPVKEGAEGQIRVVVNNIADTGAAWSKGMEAGMTFGASSATVLDAYEMSVTITVGAKTFTRTAVRHAIQTVIGSSATPQGLEIVSPSLAFERVLEQMTLRVLKEYQANL